MKKTHRGSCHCGAVRFECDIDLAAEGTSRCNCSVCFKGRFWKAVMPAADFRLLQGEESLTLYQFGSKQIRHTFCSICGTKPFGRGELPDTGPFVAVNVGCLEASDDELVAGPIVYQDGKNLRWEQAPPQTRHL